LSLFVAMATFIYIINIQVNPYFLRQKLDKMVASITKTN
jgi:hypothetical protein